VLKMRFPFVYVINLDEGSLESNRSLKNVCDGGNWQHDW